MGRRGWCDFGSASRSTDEGIEQGVVSSCRFAEWTVRWTSRVLWMAVVSQSSENSSRQENRELKCREQHTLPLLSPKSLRHVWPGQWRGVGHEGGID